MASPQFKIGVVGFSRPQFDQETAVEELRRLLAQMIENWSLDPTSTELVSGLTNMGVPKIAYQIADELEFITVGFSAKQAEQVRCGIYPVAKTIIVGERFGDESDAFIEYLDALIRIGGGPQSRHEVELFRIRFADDPDLERRLLEVEVDWEGSKRTPRKKQP